MTNSEILAKIKALGIELFGAVVFEQKEVLASNVTLPVKIAPKTGAAYLDVRDANGEGKTVFVRRGVPANKTSYDIAVFEATRDASGKTQAGAVWSVTKGTKRVFAI